MGRAGRVEAVAKAALVLAAHGASCFTGIELYVDGGLLAA
jgi:hypothetical protein